MVDFTNDHWSKMKIKGLEDRVLALEGVIIRMQGEQLRQKIAKKKAIEKAQTNKQAKTAAQLSLI
jgi:hypothetical protein